MCLFAGCPQAIVARCCRHPSNVLSSSTSSSTEFLNIDSDNKKNIEEIAALSKELVSTVPKSDWITDTGATSYITNQLRHFSGPLNWIKRRTIKIGERRLYLNQYRTAIIRVKNGKSRLTEVLYIPNLGVNLLSGKRFTKYGLRGSFNNNDLYIYIKQDIKVLRVPTRGGIYVVDRIIPELDKFILVATYISPNKSALTAPIILLIASDSGELSLDLETYSLTKSSKHTAALVSKKRDLYTL